VVTIAADWSPRSDACVRYQELNLIARTKCDDQIKAFADCAKSNGLMVVFNCRSHNTASKLSSFWHFVFCARHHHNSPSRPSSFRGVPVNECLHQYTSEDALFEFRRSKELEASAKPV